MEESSPFAKFPQTAKREPGKIYINYCGNCHYIWKAPGPSEVCINCKGYEDAPGVEVLKVYNPKIPII